MLAPLTTTSGAWSPPMPSSARTTFSVLIAAPGLGRRSLLLGRRAVGQDRHVLAVVAAMRAHRMRPLQLAAILALDVSHRRQGVMSPAHVATRLRNLLLGNSHDEISRTGAALRARNRAGPQKSYGRAHRRGGPTSLAKTLQPCNNLAAAAGFVPQGRQTGKRVPALLISARPAPLAGLGQHVLELYPRPTRVGVG